MEEQDQLAVTVGQNITRLRKMANLTQLELAEKLNYSDKSVSKWEQGNGIPDVRILVQLADLFGVSVDDLVRDHSNEKEQKTQSCAKGSLRYCCRAGCAGSSPSCCSCCSAFSARRCNTNGWYSSTLCLQRQSSCSYSAASGTING